MKVATPLAFVVPLTVVIVDEAPACESETTLPATGLPWASSSVTVIVEVVESSAGRLVALAAIVETLAETGPATN